MRIFVAGFIMVFFFSTIIAITGCIVRMSPSVETIAAALGD